MKQRSSCHLLSVIVSEQQCELLLETEPPIVASHGVYIDFALLNIAHELFTQALLIGSCIQPCILKHTSFDACRQGLILADNLKFQVMFIVILVTAVICEIALQTDGQLPAHVHSSPAFL